jgi:phosphonatase-like hydrolase
MPIKLVVFDMAGTTVKDDHDVTKAFQGALHKYGYEVPFSVIDPLMGYEKTQAIRQMLESYEADQHKITDELVHDIHREFVQQMIDHYRSGTGIEPLPHVEDTFQALHRLGIQIGINTGFSINIAQAINHRLQWQEKGLIDYIIGSDEVEKGRPYPLMIQKIMEQAGISDAAEVAKVGDTEVDIREGQQAGCRYVVGITTGTFSREELEPFHPTHIIDDIAQIIDIINA